MEEPKVPQLQFQSLLEFADEESFTDEVVVTLAAKPFSDESAVTRIRFHKVSAALHHGNLPYNYEHLRIFPTVWLVLNYFIDSFPNSYNRPSATRGQYAGPSRALTL